MSDGQQCDLFGRSVEKAIYFAQQPAPFGPHSQPGPQGQAAPHGQSGLAQSFVAETVRFMVPPVAAGLDGM